MNEGEWVIFPSLYFLFFSGTPATLNTSLRINWPSLISAVTCYLAVATRVAVLFSAFACHYSLCIASPQIQSHWLCDNIQKHILFNWILWPSLFLSVLSILSVWLMLDLFDGHTSSLERQLSSISAPHHKQHVNSLTSHFSPPAVVASKRMRLCRCVCAQDTSEGLALMLVMFRTWQALNKQKKKEKKMLRSQLSNLHLIKTTVKPTADGS